MAASPAASRRLLAEKQPPQESTADADGFSTRHTTGTTALLSEGADGEMVAALSGLGERRVIDGVTALRRVEVLRAEPPLGFVHPLVSAAVYRDMDQPARDLQHARAAHLLADGGAPDEQVAAHLVAIPRRGDTWVVDTGRRPTTRCCPNPTPASSC